MTTQLTIYDLRSLVGEMYDDTENLARNASIEGYKESPYYELDRCFVKYMDLKCDIVLGLIAEVTGTCAISRDDFQELVTTKAIMYDVCKNVREWKKVCGQ